MLFKPLTLAFNRLQVFFETPVFSSSYVHKHIFNNQWFWILMELCKFNCSKLGDTNQMERRVGKCQTLSILQEM